MADSLPKMQEDRYKGLSTGLVRPEKQGVVGPILGQFRGEPVEFCVSES